MGAQQQRERIVSLLTQHIVWVLLLVGVLGLADTAGAAPKTAGRVLGALSFRGSLSALPQWKRVVREAPQEVSLLGNCTVGAQGCPDAATTWQALLEQGNDLSERQQLQKVNARLNRWPYRMDPEAYGVFDYWATPLEFLRQSGDCEDFCIVKYYALREMGFAAERLRIVVVRDTIRNVTHAVLRVQLADKAVILDNLSDLVVSQDKYGHYHPQYSVNEHYRWAHVIPRQHSPTSFSTLRPR